MQDANNSPGGEVNLMEFIDAVRDGWRWLAGLAGLGLLGAGIALTLIPPTYEATAVIQVGQVANQLIEPPMQAIERIKTGAFQLEAARLARHEGWERSLSFSQRVSVFSLGMIKNTQLITLTAKAETRQSAIAIAEAVVAVLAKRHDEAAQPVIDRMKSDLVIAHEKLAAAEKAYASTSGAIGASRLSDERFSQFSLLTSIKQEKEAELFAQRQVVNGLRVSLSAPATQPAKMVEAVYASQRPVAPRKSLILLLGVGGGLIAGLVVVIALRWYRLLAPKSKMIA